MIAERQTLAALAADQRRRFEHGESATTLVRERAAAVDAICIEAFEQFVASPAAPTFSSVALVAVGGYGRGELHPYSDVDLLVLVDETPDDTQPDLLQPDAHRKSESAQCGSQSVIGDIERLIAHLWDCGLEVGHAVRTVADCVAEAERDITVATNLMESRLLAGSAPLYAAMCDATGPARQWPAREFFVAKTAEQQARHARFHDTAYKLEPNVKESPGGLRDIQMIGWVAKRHFGDLKEFLTGSEYQQLLAGQDYLWRVRFALHLVTGRREDRLLFDHQLKLSKLFGYEDVGHSLGVEQFMQQYYRTIIDLSRLNEVLLQLFQEAILYDGAGSEPTPIDEHFEAVNGYVQVRDADVFERTPSALLELFLVLQRNPDLNGVRSNTSASRTCT